MTIWYICSLFVLLVICITLQSMLLHQRINKVIALLLDIKYGRKKSESGDGEAKGCKEDCLLLGKDLCLGVKWCTSVRATNAKLAEVRNLAGSK